MHLIDLFAIAFGTIIGWGVFTLTSDWFEMSGPWGTFIAAYIGMLMVLPIAVSYSLLIPYIPEVGGEYRWVYRVFGELHGFIVGWWLYTSFVSIVLLNATAFPVWLRILNLRIVTWGYLYTVGRYDVYLGSVAMSLSILVVFFLINYIGVKIAGTTQTVLSLLLILGGFTYIALCLAKGSMANTLIPSPWSLKNGALRGIIAWLSIVPWAYLGFNTVPQAIEEANINPRKAFLAMFIAIIVGATFYAFITLATAAVKPWTQFLGVWLATASAAREAVGDIGVGIVIMSTLIAIMSGVNGYIYAASRLLFAMAKDYLLPQTLSEIHKKFRTPYKAIALTFTLAAIGPLLGREALLWFVNIASFGTALAYFYISFLLYRQRKSIALSSNRSELYIKTMGITSSIVSTTFIALLLHLLWLHHHFIPLIAITVYTLIGLTLYSVRRKLIRRDEEYK